MSLKVANTIVLTDDLRGRFSNTVFTNGAYLVMPEDPSVEYQFQGTISGYSSGGDILLDPGTPEVDTIDKFPFATDTNATDVGNLSITVDNTAGSSSKANGYASGGRDTPTSVSNRIMRFPFAVDTNATDAADLVNSAAFGSTGTSSSTNGYVCGGDDLPSPSLQNTIQRFPFAADNNSTDVGDLTATTRLSGGNGQNSNEHGYISGGLTAPLVDVIQRFSFASDTNAGDHGDLTEAFRSTAGASSLTHGYLGGGIAASNPPTNQNVIQKFAFASDSNASDVGDLTVGRANPAGQSSTTHGFVSGGNYSPPVRIASIEKYSFVSDGNASFVGNLTQARANISGQQR